MFLGVGLGLPASAMGGGFGAAVSWDLKSGAVPSGLTVTRAGTATYFDSTGTLQSASTNVARFDYDPSTLAAKGLLLEGARTNSIRNNTMVGAVVGTPGSLPTNWLRGTLTNNTVSVAAFGTENGVAYIELAIASTGAGGGRVQFDNPAWSANIPFSASVFARVTAGSFTNLTPFSFRVADLPGATNQLVISMLSVNGNSINTQQLQGSGTSTGTATSLRPEISWSSTGVGSINLRIGIPQLEQLTTATQTASSPILTSSVALTRAADIATIGGVPASVLAGGMGSVVVEAVLTADPSGVTARLIGAGANLPLVLTSAAGFIATNNGTRTLNVTGLSPFTTTGARAAVSWDLNGCSVAGTNQSVATDANAFGVSSPFYLGSANGINTADGWYSKIAFYNKRLPDSLLAQKVVLGSVL
jgi:hypothetical protein